MTKGGPKRCPTIRLGVVYHIVRFHGCLFLNTVELLSSPLMKLVVGAAAVPGVSLFQGTLLSLKI